MIFFNLPLSETGLDWSSIFNAFFITVTTERKTKSTSIASMLCFTFYRCNINFAKVW